MLDLYRRLADKLAEGMASQPSGPVVEWFGQAVQTLLMRMGP